MNTILKIFLFFIVVYLLYYFFGGSKALTNTTDATKNVVIPSTSFPAGTSMNYAYSIWIYIDDWNYKLNQEKIIFIRGALGDLFMPCLSLDANDNNLIVSVSTDTEPYQTYVPNIPLQKWTNLIVSLTNKSMDIYVNGKLVRTTVLPSVPKTDPNASLYLTPNGGFSGYTSGLFYWKDSITPQAAWNVYKKGPGGSMFGNLLNQYKVQLNFLKGDDVKASITI